MKQASQVKEVKDLPFSRPFPVPEAPFKGQAWPRNRIILVRCVKHVRYRRNTRDGWRVGGSGRGQGGTRTHDVYLHEWNDTNHTENMMKTEREQRRWRRCRRHQLFTVSRAMPEDRSAWMVSCSICYCAGITWITLSEKRLTLSFLSPCMSVFFFFTKKKKKRARFDSFHRLRKPNAPRRFIEDIFTLDSEYWPLVPLTFIDNVLDSKVK